MICKYSINPITNPNPFNSHTHARDTIIWLVLILRDFNVSRKKGTYIYQNQIYLTLNPVIETSSF
jgi:hypothetical protein